MIQVKSLTKVFGSYRAVDAVSFEVNAGEVLGFLGPNGAGKSTTMKMLTCFIPPTSGTATVGGFDIISHPLQARQQVGYLPESAASYGEMKVFEFLRFIAEVRGFSGKSLNQQVDRALDLTSLQDVQHQTIETLSKGYRQRTCLAQALLHDPPILILDEPTDGLDPNQKFEVRNLIKRLSEKRAILVSTHILEEVEAVCDRAVIIAQGKMVANGTPNALLEQSQFHNAVSLRISSSAQTSVCDALEKIDAVSSVLCETETDGMAFVRVFPKDGAWIQPEVVQVLQSLEVAPDQIYTERGRLDEVFRKLTLNAA